MVEFSYISDYTYEREFIVILGPRNIKAHFGDVYSISLSNRRSESICTYYPKSESVVDKKVPIGTLTIYLKSQDNIEIENLRLYTETGRDIYYDLEKRFTEYKSKHN